MQPDILKNDPELHKAFQILANEPSWGKPVKSIAHLIATSHLNETALKSALHENGIEKIGLLKFELLDLLISYIHIILDDHFISEKEGANFEILKRYFKIKEGDFFTFRRHQVEKILQRQFRIMFSDKKVDREEALQNVSLQRLFDLGYDQFELFKQREIALAIERGADISALDTATLPKRKKDEENQ